MKFSVLFFVAICAFAQTEANYYSRRDLDDGDTHYPVAGDVEKYESEAAEDENANEDPEEERLRSARMEVNNEVAAKLAGYFESFRTVITDGNEDFPIMDPLVLPSVGPITSSRAGPPIEVTLHDVQMEGLRQFIVESIIFNIDDKVLTGQIRIPWLYFTGSFECNASMPPLTLTSSGNFKSTVIDLEIHAQFNLGVLPNGRGTSLKRFVLDMVANNTTVLLTDVKGSHTLHKMINKYLQKGADNNFRDEILELTDRIAEQVTPIASDIFSRVTI